MYKRYMEHLEVALPVYVLRRAVDRKQVLRRGAAGAEEWEEGVVEGR